MTFFKIILGFFGLGIVVFIHELGHFLAAHLTKIDVEAFSIGWGNPILKKKIGTVEYRLGMFPIGGYCKMKGDDYNAAWENMRNGKTPEDGSYLASGPAARIFVHLGGPFFNLVFAVILLSFLWGFGFEINTLSNKIILASEIIPGETYPADFAGMQTGDRIIEVAGRQISYYHELQKTIALNPDKELPVMVERNGKILNLNIIPYLDKSTGAGKIGIYFWIDPVIKSIKNDSPAQRAGLMPEDRITSANGQKLRNSMDLMKIVEQNSDSLVLEYERGGITGQVQFSSNEIKDETGIVWDSISYRTPNLSLPSAIAKGIQESWKTLVVSVTSLRLLFKGIDLTKAVSGPVRITYMIGELATQSFEQGFGTSVRSITDFLALVSIALCVMNLLPLPILDGGMIVLFLVELIRRKPAHPKAVSAFQTCGMVIIFGLMIFALFGDILFFIQR